MSWMPTTKEDYKQLYKYDIKMYKEIRLNFLNKK